MRIQAATVDEYLAALPEDRRAALQSVRETIRANLGDGYAEGMQYGMIGYFVPHSVYPPGYHCDPRQPLPFAGLASQKNHMSLYLSCLYGSGEHEARFRREWAKTGKKLDMGKACIRFKKLEDLPLEVIGQAVARIPAQAFIAHYESAIKPTGKGASKTTESPKQPARSATRRSSEAAAKPAPKATPRPAASATAKSAPKAASESASTRTAKTTPKRTVKP